MKNVLLITILSILAIGGGIALVIAADHYGWVSPETTETTETTETVAVSNDLCTHQIDAERCPFCNPELVESMGWCNGHDVPEALCTRCSGEIVTAFKEKGDWCAEHSLPESQCTICNGEALPAESDSAQSTQLASLTEESAGDDVMRANRKPSEKCINAFSMVQLNSPKVARRAGLEVVPVEAQSISETVTCNAEVAFDGDHYAHLASRASGVVAEVAVDLGDHVEAGRKLAVIDSSGLGSAKAAYLQARSLVDLWQKNATRERSLFEKNVGTEKDVLEAETRLVESNVQLSNAKQRLKNLGLSDDDIALVVQSDDTSSLLHLRAPFAGVVVERSAVTGEVVTTSQPLFAIADIQTMWVMLDVYESDVARLQKGQEVTIGVDAMSGRTFDGTLTWISSHVDPKTRTIKARAEVENPDGLLRANMFGRAEIHVKNLENAVLVPESAVQWDGCCNLVFVRQTDTVYQPYKVTLGYKRNGHYVVEDGLSAGESVVTQGSFLLKTEILKGNIGAGCCEVDPGADK